MSSSRILAARALGQLLVEWGSVPHRYLRFIYRLESVNLLQDIFHGLEEYEDYLKLCGSLAQTLLKATDSLNEWEFIYSFLDALWSNHESELVLTLERYELDRVAADLVEVMIRLGLKITDHIPVIQWVLDLLTCMVERERLFGIAALVPGREGQVLVAQSWADRCYRRMIGNGSDDISLD